MTEYMLILTHACGNGKNDWQQHHPQFEITGRVDLKIVHYTSLKKIMSLDFFFLIENSTVRNYAIRNVKYGNLVLLYAYRIANVRFESVWSLFLYNDSKLVLEFQAVICSSTIATPHKKYKVYRRVEWYRNTFATFFCWVPFDCERVL